MKVINEIYRPDIAILPVGGHYTMDVENALVAAEWIGAKIVIPMHYNTFPQINTDISSFEKGIIAQGKKAVIMDIEETIEF